MSLGTDLPSRIARGAFAGLMLIAWSGWSDRAAAQAARESPATPPSPQAVAEKAARAFRAIEAAHKNLPRDTFDVAAVALQVGDDPALLKAWVKERTAWVPYHGALRGAVGVLMDRRGNSLDRSLLLAELVESRGRTARLARATLPESLVKRLAEGLTFDPPPPPAPPAKVGRAAIDDAVRDYAEPFGLDPVKVRRAAEELLTRSDRVGEDMVQRTVEQSAVLAAMVWPDGVGAGGPAAAAADPAAAVAVAAALGDHWWVQVRDGDAWADVDPVVADADRPRPAETVERRPGVPGWPLEARQCHEVEVRVVVERWAGGRLAEQAVLRHPLRPMDLFGRHVTVTHSPLNWPGDVDLTREADPAARLRGLASAEREWLPVIRVGASAFHEGSVSDAGLSNPKSDLGLFTKSGKAAAAAAGAAAGALNAREPAAAAAGDDGVLTAEWLDYEVRSPGRPPERFRRQVFDLVGPAARAAAAGGPVARPVIDPRDRVGRGLALLGQTQVLVVGCDLSTEFVDDLTARSMRAMQAPLTRLLAATDDDGVTASGTALLQLPPPPGRLYDLAVTRHVLNPRRADVHLDRPNVFTEHQFVRDDAARGILYVVATDIVTNASAVRPGLGPAAARQARLSQGTLDTAAETLLMDPNARAAALSDELAARPDAKDWLVVRDRNDPAWRAAGLPADLRARVDADLAQGYAAVVPRGRGAGGSPPGWWRIDPATGQSLGMNADGWGASMTEYANLFLVTFIGCFAAAAAAGKAGAAGSPNGAHNKRTTIACAMVALAFACMAPVGGATILLKTLVGGVATGAAGGYAL